MLTSTISSQKSLPIAGLYHSGNQHATGLYLTLFRAHCLLDVGLLWGREADKKATLSAMSKQTKMDEELQFSE